MTHRAFFPRHETTITRVCVLAAIVFGVWLSGSISACGEPLPTRLRHPAAADAIPLALAGAADVFTTEWGLVPGRSHEGNPLGQTRLSRIGIKTTANVGAFLLIRRLHSTGRHRAARGTKYGLVAVQLAVSVVNYKVGRRARRER